MTTYRFDKYEFDTDSYELRAAGVVIAMRPKTAVLMAVLIEQRANLLGKQSLFSQVWQSDHVQHQSLFQAISELRKILAPLQPIKTHPNLGYQWVAPVKELRERRWLRKAAGALLPLASIGAVLIWYWQPPTPATNPLTPPPHFNSQSMLQSPAMQAFSNGIEQLNNHQLTSAWDYFELAERENPLFLEASMMKAEILFEQANYPAAKQLTDELLAQAITRGEHYIEVSAQGLLSRISEKSGQWNHALDWALKADSNARSQGFACVAENTRTRISGLLDENDLPANGILNTDKPELDTPLVKDKEKLATEYPDASHCEPLNDSVKSGSVKPDLSQCLDMSSEYQSLAINQQQNLLHDQPV